MKTGSKPKVNKLRDIEEIMILCRKYGASSFRHDDLFIEFSASLLAPNIPVFDPTKIMPDKAELSPEDILFWSAPDIMQGPGDDEPPAA